MKIAALIVSFILWGILIGGWVLHTSTVITHEFDEPQTPTGIDRFSGILLAMSVVIGLWVVLLRWFYKSFLVRSGRLKVTSGATWVLLVVIGALIWIPAESITIYGLVVFFSSQNYFLYAIFALISLFLLGWNFPLFLAPRSTQTA